MVRDGRIRVGSIRSNCKGQDRADGNYLRTVMSSFMGFMMSSNSVTLQDSHFLSWHFSYFVFMKSEIIVLDLKLLLGAVFMTSGSKSRAARSDKVGLLWGVVDGLVMPDCAVFDELLVDLMYESEDD